MASQTFTASGYEKEAKNVRDEVQDLKRENCRNCNGQDSPSNRSESGGDVKRSATSVSCKEV